MPANGVDCGLVAPGHALLDNGLPGDDSLSSATSTVNGINGVWKLSTKRSDLSAHSMSEMTPQPSGVTMVGGSLNGLENGGPSFVELEGRDPAEQIEVLKDMLEKTVRVKEGAESILRREFPSAGRSRIEAQMNHARARIDEIRRKIEYYSTEGRRKMSVSSVTAAAPRKRRFTDEGKGHARTDSADKEDYRSAKQQVLLLLKSLLSDARQSIKQSSQTAGSSLLGFPPASTEEELNVLRMDCVKRLTDVLRKSVRVRLDLNMNDLVEAVSPLLSDRSPTKTRAAGYRALRHALVDRESVERLQQHDLDWYILRSLVRDNKFAGEREQVIKLIRSIVEIGSERRAPHALAGLGCVPLSEALTRALVAIAEHPEDSLNSITIETLMEIFLIDIDLVSKSGGMRVLLQTLVDGPAELLPIMASALLIIADAPKTRMYLNPGTDLESAMSGVTDAYGKGTIYGERMRVAAKITIVMLRTWSGLMCLCMNDMLAIRTIVDTLRLPSMDTREIVLDMFFDLLNIKTPEWHQTFIEGKRLTMYRRQPPPEANDDDVKTTPTKQPERLTLSNQYISLLVIVLVKAGLLDALTALLEEQPMGSSLSRKGTLLVAEILQISNRTLPTQCAAKMQHISKIFELAADFGNGAHRNIGTGVLSSIDSFNRHRAQLQRSPPPKNARQRANSVEDSLRRGPQRQVEQAKIKNAMAMDDRTFQTALVDTQVMMSKDFTKWNYDTLLELVEGPLLNPKRLEEAIKVSKFVKRLMSFFHPFSQFSQRFADIKRQKGSPNYKWIKLGCVLLSTLLANPDGVKYLATEDEFLPQIVRGFTQLDPQNRQSESETVFSKKKVEETLTYGYLEMLGTLSKNKDGVELLEKFKIFTAFYHVSDLKSRDDLVKGIIENVDYSADGHARIVLSKALTSSYKHIREYATTHLGQLIQACTKVNSWMLRLLVTQLYDPDQKVCERAVHFLEEVCDSPEILHVVVDMQPTLEHLGDIANSLLYKFMSTPVGFRYLYDVGFIEREMDAWLRERNENYVIEVEVHLSRKMTFNPTSDDAESLHFEGTAPRHFYGELARTELGCQILRERGHVSDFAYFIRTHGHESDNFRVIHRLKSIIWAIGNIAASQGGLHFLEEDDIIPIILEIADQSEVLSVRGTCFYALGLASSTSQGAEILSDYGWESTLSPLGVPTGLCFPSDIEKFVTVPPWDTPSALGKPTGLLPPSSQQEVDILAAINQLANTVIANAASRSLAKMKSKAEFRKAFSSTTLFYRAIHVISNQRFRLPVRRYILELFDVQLDPTVVKKLSECARLLVGSGNLVSPKSAKLQPRVVSMFGRPGRGRNPSDSSDEDSMDSDGEVGEIVVERPVSLQPVKRVVGFLDVTSSPESS